MLLRYLLFGGELYCYYVSRTLHALNRTHASTGQGNSGTLIQLFMQILCHVFGYSKYSTATAMSRTVPKSRFPISFHMWAFAVCDVFELGLSGYMLPGLASSPHCILQWVSVAVSQSPLGTYLRCAGYTKDLSNPCHDIVGRGEILCVRNCSALAHSLLNGSRDGQGGPRFHSRRNAISSCYMQRSLVSMGLTSVYVCA